MQKDPLCLKDDDIVRQVLAGNVNAFETLVKRHKARVLGIVRRHVPPNEVEEEIQEVFIRAYGSLRTFRGKSDFAQWLSSIAVKTCCDYWRKAYRSREIPMSVITDKHRAWLEEALAEGGEMSLQETSARKEATELLDWALNRLSAEDRMILELVYLEGLTLRRAADLTGWSLANVKIRSFRARRKLEKMAADFIERRGASG